MSDRVCNVLFLCTGNSARSIIAETLLDSLGAGRFNGYSAGSHPAGAVNALVLEHLRAAGMTANEARSKSWDEFARPGAPPMDLVITVCDQAAGETCPVWPGGPAKAHWPAPDPAAHMSDRDAARRVIRDVTELMQRRVRLLVALPVDELDRASLQARARAIVDAPCPSLAGH